jgi:hypothetical protein
MKKRTGMCKAYLTASYESSWIDLKIPLGASSKCSVTTLNRVVLVGGNPMMKAASSEGL